MKYDKIIGLEKNISKLIMGNDNQIYFDEASKLWDHWIEVGGNAFDTAYVYGGGSQEKLLGDWHRKRNNLKDLVIILLTGGVLALLGVIIIGDYYVAVSENRPIDEEVITLMKMALTGLIGIIAGYMGSK